MLATFDSSGWSAYRRTSATVTDADRARVDEAVRSCPVAAFTVRD